MSKVTLSRRAYRAVLLSGVVSAVGGVSAAARQLLDAASPSCPSPSASSGSSASWPPSARQRADAAGAWRRLRAELRPV